MTISEPTTLATNALLAAAAAALGARLRAAPSGPATRLWGGAFLAGALAASAGGIVHGLGPRLTPALHAVLWKTVLAASGLACALLLAGAAVAASRGPARRAGLAAVGGALAAYLVLASRSDDIRLAAGAGGTTIALLLGLTLARGREDGRRLALLAGALALSAAGLAAQQARLPAPAPFNHNDVCHLLQFASLWPFYRAGLRLAPGPNQALAARYSRRRYEVSPFFRWRMSTRPSSPRKSSGFRV